jgi:hypothetical protein
MSKLRVNALWGGICAKRYLLPPDVRKLAGRVLQSPRIKRDSLAFRQIYGDLFECRYEYLDEAWGRAHNVNPSLAASVTGCARVLLHKKVRKTSAAYCHTDSVIYLHKPSIHPERWPDEGCWGDEL